MVAYLKVPRGERAGSWLSRWCRRGKTVKRRHPSPQGRLTGTRGHAETSISGSMPLLLLLLRDAILSSSRAARFSIFVFSFPFFIIISWSASVTNFING